MSMEEDDLKWKRVNVNITRFCYKRLGLLLFSFWNFSGRSMKLSIYYLGEGSLDC